MSEQELREKMNRADRNATIFAAILTLGVMSAVFSFITSRGLWLGIVGTGLIVLGLIYGGANRMRYDILLEELQALLRAKTTSVCPKCKKQIPQGNFTSCPYCDERLTTQKV